MSDESNQSMTNSAWAKDNGDDFLYVLVFCSLSALCISAVYTVLTV